MKIGFDAKRLFNNSSGLGNYSRALVRNIQLHFPEHEFHLFTSKIEENKLTKYFLDKSKFIVHKYDGPLSSYWRSRGISQEIESLNLDIFHGLSHEIPLGLEKTNTKSVVSMHDLIPFIYPNDFGTMDNLIYKSKMKFSCKNADKIIAVSENTKSDVHSILGTPLSKISVIHPICQHIFENYGNGLTDNKSKHPIPSNYLLSVGSLISRKNVLNILKAYNQIDKAKRVKLVIVGEGKAYKTKILEHIIEYDLSDDVQILNSVESKDLPLLYANASGLIYISKYEGFGLPVVESLLMKTPVITGNSSSLKEFNHASVIHVDADDIDQISQAIQTVENISFDDSFNLDKYSSTTLSNKLMELYESIVLK